MSQAGSGSDFDLVQALQERQRLQLYYAPLLAALLAVAAQPFVEADAATRRAAIALGIVVALGLASAHMLQSSVAGHGGGGSDHRSLYSTLGKWVLRAVAHVLCWQLEHEAHSALLRLASVVLFPLSGVRDCDGPLFAGYLGLHFLFTCLHVGVYSGGWQWLLVLMVSDVILLDISSWASEQRSCEGKLHNTTQVVQSLLNTICDGCLLLTDEGVISGADMKASSLLNLGGVRPPSSHAPRIGGVLEGVLERGVLVRGLRMLQLSTGWGAAEPLHVEVYIIPCPLDTKDIVMLGIHVAPNAPRGAAHLCVLRLADGGLEPSTLRMPLTSPPARRSGLKAAPSAVSVNPSSPGRSTNAPRTVHIHHVLQETRHGKVFRSEGSAVESGLGSPRTQVTTFQNAAGPQGSPVPGIPMHALETVGLGVGSYTKVRMVGKGSQGSVWQVTAQDGTFYAQKEIDLKGVLWHRDFPKRLKDADREVRALKGLAWASCVIVPIVDCWIQNDFELSCIVMEWLPHTLDGVLRSRAADRMLVHQPQACNWLARLAAGLAAIHATGFIHRDLKPSNILLDESLKQCKITDLGVSRALHNREDTAQPGHGLAPPCLGPRDRPAGAGSAVGSVLSQGGEEKFSMVSENMGSILSGYTVRPGTIAYTSPEANESCHYGCEADIFSLGVVLLEVLTLQTPPEPRLGQVPAPSATADRAQKLLVEMLPGGDAATWTELRRLCFSMVRPEPQLRPSARDVANSRSLASYMEVLCEVCPKLKAMLS